MGFDTKAMQTDAAHLKEGVLDILQKHKGAARAIRAQDIAASLGRTGKYSDRPIREAIKQLRRDGVLVISSVGNVPGYYIAQTREEWETFRDSNLRPRAIDILTTSQAMAVAALRTFGTEANLHKVQGTFTQVPLQWPTDIVA